jgi:hypothetical protein
MKEKQILITNVSDLEFAESGYVAYNTLNGTYCDWTVYFLHEGEEKQGKLYASLENPQADHGNAITLL